MERIHHCLQGHMVSTKESVTIKVPRVPDYIRKEKKEVKIHMEEAKKLLATPFKKPRHENLVRYLNVAYDDFRKEIWVVGCWIPKELYNRAPPTDSRIYRRIRFGNIDEEPESVSSAEESGGENQDCSWNSEGIEDIINQPRSLDNVPARV